jgi:lysozyme
MTIPGNDVSFWQGVIDFAKMKTLSEFVFIKSTQGNYFDTKYSVNHANSAGIIPRGPYHFYDWRYSLQANIDALVNAWTMYPGCELPPVLDYEATVSVPAQNTAAGMCLTWLKEVEQRTGRTPLLYTSPGYWAAHGSTKTDFANYPLFVAHYGVNTPTTPKPWTSWLFWQYSSKGDGPKYGVSSAAIDLDLGNFATVDEFKIWAGIMPPPPPAPTLEERVTQLETNALTTEARLQALEAALHIVYMPQIGKG